MDAFGEYFYTGSACVFDGTMGEQLLKFVAADGEALFFGRSVVVNADGARVGVGAYRDDSFTDSAYVLDCTTDVQLLKLVAADGEACRGSARVSDGSSTGEQLLKLEASEGQEDDFFGTPWP